MSEAIDYEKEVKKVYPDAYSYIPQYFDLTAIKDKATGKEIGTGYFAESAWIDAYTKLPAKQVMSTEGKYPIRVELPHEIYG